MDGRFPNHHPDPSKLENLSALVQELKTGPAELGLAFDGDADRLGVVTKGGKIILPDRQLMLYAQDVLSRNPGAEIIYDVKCTRLLAPWIERHGGRADDLEDRPLPGEGEAEGNRRAARRRDVRAHLLQGALVRLRRRDLLWRETPRNSFQREKSK